MPFKLIPSALFLIAANLVPIFGIFIFGWDAVTILVLYWLESIIIGVINIPKILSCRQEEGARAFFVLGNLFTAVFFTVHFGGFTAGHGAILCEAFGAADIMNGLLSGGPLLWTAFTFLFSHIFSMFINFFGKKEYLGRKPNEQMFQPYGRVVIMHLVVLLGGILIQQFGSPIYAVILLIVLKTAIDLVVHNKEHAKKSALTA